MSKNQKGFSVVEGILIFVIVAILGGTGWYVYNSNKKTNDSLDKAGLGSPKQSLSANKTVPENKSTSDTFTYSPKTGGLSLTLPKSYGIVVNVDGNAGGAPGAIFRVASVTNNNVFSDASYQGVEIDISNTFTNLDHAVSAEESSLDGQRSAGSTVNRNYNVTDTKVAGLPAKLLTADGLDEYQGKLSVYIVGSGSFTYKIIANGTQNGSFALLSAVLKGMTIKPVTM